MHIFTVSKVFQFDEEKNLQSNILQRMLVCFLMLKVEVLYDFISVNINYRLKYFCLLQSVL